MSSPFPPLLEATGAVASDSPPTPEVVPTLSGSFPPGPKVVYAQHPHDGTVTFWAASPVNPAYRLPLATAADPSDFGINAALSPGGKMIAYVALPEGNYDNRLAANLWVVNTDGTEQQQVANRVYLDGPDYPLWSPDDRYIVFVRAEVVEEMYENTTIWVLDTQTGEESLLATSNVTEKKFVWPLGWSEDGSGFFYLSGNEVHFFSLQDKISNLIVPIPPFSAGWRLSPDGTQLLYNVLGDRESGQHNLIVTSLQNKHEEMVITTNHIKDRGDYFMYIWHPNSQTVTISEKSGQKRSSSLQVIDIEAKSVISSQLQSSNDYIARSWSPDGLWLAAQSASSPGGDLYFFFKDGETATQLATAGATDVLGWLMKD